MKKVLTILVALALAPLTFAADDIAWGLPDNGMRLGIALDQSATPATLRVLIQNTTATARNVLVNMRCNTRTYPLEFTARSPEGKPYLVWDRVWGDMPVIGPDCPVYAKIDPSGSYEFKLILTDLVQYSPKPPEPTDLDTLLKAGFVLRVSGDLRGDPYNGLHWKVVSVELRLLRQ